MQVRDPNGKVLRPNIRRQGEGWAVTVWMGGAYFDGHAVRENGSATDVRRYVYATAIDARRADISHQIGEHGRIN
jgi:hypothetical protein